jgi:hypothetical protein
MAIVGLTKGRKSSGFPKLGDLRKGEPKTAQGHVGKDTTYFRFTSSVAGAESAFKKLYQAQPRNLLIILPYQTPELNFDNHKARFSGSRLQHKCDGVTTTNLHLGDGKYTQEPHPCPGGCKPVGYLNVVLYDMLVDGFTGPTVVHTTSVWDIIKIDSALKLYYEMAQVNGSTLQGMELMLSREPETKPTPKHGRKEFWLINLRPRSEWVKAQFQLQYQQSMGTLPTQATHALSPGNGIPNDAPITVIEHDPVYDIEPEGELVEEPALPPKATKKRPKKQTAIAEIEELGKTLYGAKWDVSKQSMVNHYKEGAKALSDLTQTMLDKALKALVTKMDNFTPPVNLEALDKHLAKLQPDMWQLEFHLKEILGEFESEPIAIKDLITAVNMIDPDNADSLGFAINYYADSFNEVAF